MSTTTDTHSGFSTRISNLKVACGPDIELRMSPMYAWIGIVFGVIFFILGLFIASPAAKGRNVGLGLFITLASAAGVYGANYWRQHLPLVARLTARQLVLQRSTRVAIDWTNIAEIEKKSVTVRMHGALKTAELVLIRFKSPVSLTQKTDVISRLNQVLMNAVKDSVLGGYDVVVNPQEEFMRTADWFLGECRKRISATTTNN